MILIIGINLLFHNSGGTKVEKCRLLDNVSDASRDEGVICVVTTSTVLKFMMVVLGAEVTEEVSI